MNSISLDIQPKLGEIVRKRTSSIHPTLSEEMAQNLLHNKFIRFFMDLQPDDLRFDTIPNQTIADFYEYRLKLCQEVMFKFGTKMQDLSLSGYEILLQDLGKLQFHNSIPNDHSSPSSQHSFGFL